MPVSILTKITLPLSKAEITLLPSITGEEEPLKVSEGISWLRLHLSVPSKIEKLLNELIEVAKDERQNIMPITIELVDAGATMGDIVEKLRTLWGTYRENPVF